MKHCRILCNMSSLDDGEVQLHEDFDWTFKHRGHDLVELDDLETSDDDLGLIHYNQNNPDFGTGFILNNSDVETGLDLANLNEGTDYNDSDLDARTDFNQHLNVGTNYNLIEPDVGTVFNLIEPDLSFSGRHKDDWEEDSLSSNEWGPLVADELTFEPFTRRTKTASRCRLAIFIVLTVCIVALIAIGLVLGLKAAQSSYQQQSSGEKRPVYLYQHAAVATDAGPCSDIARDFLQQGGSAIDANIAALVCSGLYNPQSTGVGGGHFMMYYHHETNSVVMIDARECAPLAATKEMYNNGTLSSVKGGASIAVPGEIAGFWKAHQLYGKLEWKTLFEPTIRLAREGFHTSASLAGVVVEKIEDIKESPILREIFLKEDGRLIEEGDIIYRKRFADTLETIANEGGEAFYQGQLAQDIVKDIQDNGGIITMQDLEQYEARMREPLTIRLDNGMSAFTPPPPSSGAVLSLILNIIDGYGFNKSNFDTKYATTQALHKVIEAFKFAFAQRSYLGDEDFIDVNKLVSNMTSRAFADALRSKISDNTTHDAQYYGLLHSITDDHGTSQICILDQFGNAVSATGTVNLYLGSKVMGNRTGIIFNNEMDDFSKPNAANFFGFPPSEANFIEPRKRPMSSMTPLIIVDQEGAVQLVVGASGGSRIPSAIAEITIKHLWGGFSVTDAIRQKRLHHQWIPNLIQYEKGYDQDILSGLRVKGHNMTEKTYLSIVQGISRNQDGAIEAVSDERKGGVPAGF